MSSEWGKNIKVDIFGASHAEFVGVTLSGLVSGHRINTDELWEFMKRRAPGAEGTSRRKESDRPVIESGITDGYTDGKPIRILIYNEDARSSDYDGLRYIPRPGHADYPAYVKSSGREDMRGGGRFSGRMTAPLCAAGGIAKQILSGGGVEVEAKLETAYVPETDDSVGGIVSCTVSGLPTGIGGALFDGIDGRIASAVFGIPAVKGIEFGAGFKTASMKGSENNDQYVIRDGKVTCLTNNAGGVLGGMTDGMPLTLNVAFKPTPSIAKKQKSVDLLKMKETELEIKGRHDPCVAVRAVPAVEAAVALAVLDVILDDDENRSKRETIDIIDSQIAALLRKRFEMTDSIGEEKRQKGIPVEDTAREKEIIGKVSSIMGEDLAAEAEDIYSAVFKNSKKRQNI